MKRQALILILLFILPIMVSAQDAEESGSALQSEKINERGKLLDAQIVGLNKKMAEVIKKYNLLKTTDIRVVPYQTQYNLGDNYIEMEKHSFVKDEIYRRGIVGIRTKKIKIFTDGNSINKIESEIYEKDYYTGEANVVKIVDPSPTTEGTDDVVFNHTDRGKVLVDNKKLGDIRNTTAFPVQNELKTDFLIPHLSQFSDSLLFIAEAYYKSLKDTDVNMYEFLKSSTKY